jgi:hypothetical protein
MAKVYAPLRDLLVGRLALLMGEKLAWMKI